MPANTTRKTPNDPAAGVSCIHESLRHLAVPLDTLNPDPENVRLHDDRSIDGIAASLNEFGQDQVIVVQREGMIIRKGNGRYLAARKLGWTHLAAIVVDEERIKAMSRAIADNRTMDLSRFDDQLLAAALTEISGKVTELWTPEESAKMLASLDEEPAKPKSRSLRSIETAPPPPLTWVLLGIPTPRFGEIAEDVERLAKVDGIICETTVSGEKAVQVHPS